MGHCETLDVMIGFDKGQADVVKEQLEQNDKLLIDPKRSKPKHIILADDGHFLPCYDYVACRVETRTLMRAALAAISGEQVEFLTLYSTR